MKVIGDVPGVKIGQEFKTRRDAHDAGVHRPLQGGICGTKATGAESICVSGGYKDDEDYGDVIVYTGHGGQDQKKNQVADQTLDDPGNAALLTSLHEGRPVRVLRGYQAGTKHSPKTGYRYDGLFRVSEYGWKVGVDGYWIVQFTMQSLESPSTPALALAAPDSAPSSEAGKAPRKETTTQRIVRNTSITRAVKALHGGRCQLCGLTLQVPGGAYSEGAHIQALGKPYDGPDVAENVLCLCPNCHVQFDAGAVYLTDELVVMRHGEEDGKLLTVPGHDVGLAYIQSHRARWGK
jgi:predicted restriction endonuclease